MITKSSAGDGDPPIACTLHAGALQDRLGDWQELLAHVTQRLPIDEGVRLEMAPDTPIDKLTRLVAAEQDCCRFLRLALTFDTRGVGLEVRGPDDARSVMEALFGAG
jgi:MerR family copper efflux transcriptional regulator